MGDNNEVYDRFTALEVMKDISRRMRPSWDLFGKPTLVISRESFEEIRKKYLGQSKGESNA